MRALFGVLAVLMLTASVGAQEREFALSDRQQDDLAFARRLATLYGPVPTFKLDGTTYFVERRRDIGEESIGYRLVDLQGNDAPDDVKLAYVTRCMYAGSRSEDCAYSEPVVGSFTVVDPDEYYREVDAQLRADEGLVKSWSLHWVPIGAARSYSEPAGRGKQNYLPFALGATVFTHRVDGGRLYLNGVSVAWAVGNSDPTSNWAGTVQVSYVPVSIRIRDRWSVGPTLGTAEITGRSWLRWKGFKTVGVQVAVCMTDCD